METDDVICSAAADYTLKRALRFYICWAAKHV